MNAHSRSTPRFLKFKSDLLRCAIVVVLNAAIVLRSNAETTEHDSCKNYVCEFCETMKCMQCCTVTKWTYTAGVGWESYLSVEWADDSSKCPKSERKPDEPEADGLGDPDSGSPDATCAPCSNGSSSPTTIGSSPSTLAQSGVQNIALGSDPAGQYLGSVQISPGVAGTGSITLADVGLDFGSGSPSQIGSVTSPDTTLRQFNVPGGMVAASENADGSMSVQTFLSSTVTPPDPGTGLRSTTPGAMPVAEITISRLIVDGEPGLTMSGSYKGRPYERIIHGVADGSGGIFREYKNGMAIDTVHTYSADTSDADGLAHVVSETKHKWGDTSDTDPTNDLVPVSTAVRTFRTLPISNKEVMLDETVSIGAEVLTTVKTYDEQAIIGTGETAFTNKSYGAMLSEVKSDGSWIRFDYNPATGLATRIYKPWLGAPASPSQATLTNCVVEEFFYDEVDPMGESRHIVSILGQEVAREELTRSFTLTSRTETRETTRRRLAADGTVEAYSTTKVWNYTVDVLGNRKLISEKNENGVMTHYKEQRGTFNPASSAFTQSTNGAHRAVHTYHPVTSTGQAVTGQTLRRTLITNEAGQTLREATAYASGNGAWASVAFQEYEARKHHYDAAHRLTSLTSKDGAELESVSYQTVNSNLKRTVVDAEGTSTDTYIAPDGTVLSKWLPSRTSGQDAVEGVMSYSAASITGDGRSVEQEMRYGYTADINYPYSSVTLASTFRDTAGRVVERRDMLGLATKYAYATDLVVENSQTRGVNRVTETLPNGATRIIERYSDGRLRSITGTGVVAEFHSYTLNADHTITEVIHQGEVDGPRWTRVIRDYRGAVLKEEKPNPTGGADVTTAYFHDNSGRVVRVSRPSLGAQITEYDSLGNVTARGVDMNGNNVLNRASADQITEHTSQVLMVSYAGAPVACQLETTRILSTDGNPGAVQTRTVRRHLGCGPACAATTEVFEPDGTIRTEQATVNRTTGVKTVIRKEKPASSNERTLGTQYYLNGVLVRESITGVIGDITHEYETILQRRIKTTHPRMGVQSWDYNAWTNNDWLGYGTLGSTTVGEGAAARTTRYEFYPLTYNGDAHPMAGQLAAVVQPDGTETARDYDLMGRVTHEGGYVWLDGQASYQVEYGYDSLGQRTTMQTYRHANAGPDTTTWAYQPATGLLESKTDAKEKTVTYTYDAAGQLHTRIWAREKEGNPLITTYTRDAAGRVTQVTYSDGTPAVTTAYDRTGRPVAITDASGTRTHAYNGPGGAQSATSYNGASGPLASLSVSHGYNNAFRTSINVLSGTGILSTTGYQYDPATGRMSSITHAGQTAAYDWTTQTAGLPGVIEYSGAHIRGTRTPDAKGRLDDITWRIGGASGQIALKNDYTYDSRDRRAETIREDGSPWSYTYNSKSELITATRGGQHFEYDYDRIGNRITATETGVNATEALTTTYQHMYDALTNSTNPLNQYTKITNPDPGKRKITGQANTDAALSVTQSNNGVPAGPQPQITRDGTAFSATVQSATTSAPAFAKVIIEGRKAGAGVGGQDIVARKETGFYFPPKDESLDYDEDGNLILDGRWDWSWDAENRLKAMETNVTAAAAGVPKQRLEFTYDSQSRRVRKVVREWNNSQFTVVTDRSFLYDGWNVIAEFESGATGPVALRATYAWGLDLSGTETGAGGVGGLVFTALSNSTTTGLNNILTTQLRVLAPLYDGNGNVLAYAMCSTGQVLARYEYDPFGKLLMKEEDASVAGRLHHQFSTKYCDVETGLNYYGFRFYSPDLGRWPSRDPIGERGGINLYGMIGNDAVNRLDRLGLNDPIMNIQPLIDDLEDIGDALGDLVDCIPTSEEDVARLIYGDCAIDIFKKWDTSMVKGRVSGGDKWHHCMANCEVANKCGKDIAKSLSTLKEIKDCAKNDWERFSANYLGGKMPRINNAEDMIKDALEDLTHNATGYECDSIENCECCCYKYHVNGLP